MEIIELSHRPDLLDRAVQYFWSCWGSDSNRIFYQDCIENSLQAEKQLPKFYLSLAEDHIIGSYALLTNDLISRQDLMPWLACLYVEEDHRKKGHAESLLHHGLQEAHRKGFDQLYLSTDLVDFYERKGWTYFSQAYGVTGGVIKIYQKATH